MATCDVGPLMVSGKCFVPLEPKQLAAVQIQLLCDLKTAMQSAISALPACCEARVEALEYAATMELDFDGEKYQTVTLTGDVDFATSINRPAAGSAKSIVVIITCDGSDRNLAFNANWIAIGNDPATITASKVAVLSLTAIGPAETDVLRAYNVQP